MTKGVYCLTSPSGKRYVGVGCSKNGIEDRWRKYKKLHCKDQPKLYNALKKYGPENFKYEVILETDDTDNAKRSEMYLIDVWNLQDDAFGYNITSGGDGSNGFKHSLESINKIKNRIISEETKLKMSIAQKEYRKNNTHPMLGKSHRKESKLKISLSNTGKKSPFKGKKHSEDSKNKISLSKLRKTINE